MKIELSTLKGRTRISTSIDTNFEDEQDWQDFMLVMFDFLSNAGVQLPEEIEDAIEEFLVDD